MAQTIDFPSPSNGQEPLLEPWHEALSAQYAVAYDPYPSKHFISLGQSSSQVQVGEAQLADTSAIHTPILIICIYIKAAAY